MQDLLKKLNYTGQQPLVLFNAPTAFAQALQQTLPDGSVQVDVRSNEPVSFALAFVTQQAQIDALIGQLAPLLQGDATLWFAYPKGSSKNYTCDFNRDTGWQSVGQAGFEPVRMVAIDSDWSALRFRRVAYIKTMTRQRHISDEGKARTNASSR
ncbi:hypothetical protein FAES_3683 [Fibrella aestuarina BUZ 2]|uniref:DUF3052 domain-containing protein n=1 Tax=Fibrella aestuarina BUZ 2 TaxID=1166018 RepID=I0KC37_9BACT|nr:hypothetical protein [Fibrella aestuarina]CCH01690.1 hypothetical protein FAES_3683 [Fibrella aestuarina BUZ 2]